MGHAFACVKGRWVECISEHYARFKGRTEREMQLATEELRQRHRRHGQQLVLTTAKLADFLSSVEAEEVLLTQRQRDHEARAVFSLMEGTLAPIQTISASNHIPTETTTNNLSTNTVASTAANPDRH